MRRWWDYFLYCFLRKHEWEHEEYWTGMAEVYRYKWCLNCGLTRND